MIRMQVQLTEEQLAAVREIAARKGVSLSDVVRRAVDNFVARERGMSRTEQRARAIRAIGMFASGTSDVSENHDRYLAEAYKR